MKLGEELLKDIKDIIREPNGLTVEQRDRIFLTTVAVILEQQNILMEKLKPLEDLEKKVNSVPSLIWAAFEKPRQAVVIGIIIFIVMSALYVKESRDALLAFLATLF